MSKPNVIEKVKNLILVVLFLSTVLLLYFFWGNISFDDLRNSPAQVAGEVPTVADLLKPDQITVNFGNDNYTVIPPDGIWYNNTDKDSFVKELKRFGPTDNVIAVEITYAQYQQVMKYESIWADFNYDIPMKDFCAGFKIDNPQSYDAIETVTGIGYSTAEKGNSLYVYDGKNHKYYRIVADSDKSGVSANTNFPEFIASIQAQGNNIYYPISTYMANDNNTLIPPSVKANLRKFPFQQDIYSYQTEKINAKAEEFFGRNFDFVRNITEENGTVIYMYGYGQNVLIVNTDGSIEYKEEQTSSSGDQSFKDALETAVNFVAGHGSWEFLKDSGMKAYVKNVIPDPNKKKGYRFIFGLEVNGSRIYYENGDPIVVDVNSGQVTYYKRHLIDFDKNDIDSIEASSDAEDAFSAVNVIAQNSSYIYNILLGEGEVKATADQNAMLETIGSMVTNMQIGYVMQAEAKNTEIQPVWAVSISNGAVMYFDLYNAKPIGYSKE